MVNDSLIKIIDQTALYPIYSKSLINNYAAITDVFDDATK